jgi:DNA-binding transcriptional regulator YhcF (GntR family)
MPEARNPEADPRKYIQLAALLRGCIRDGTLQPGDRAPSIAALAAGQGGGCARQTCAKAFHLLEAEGLLVRVHGLGYFISGPASTPANSSTPRPVLHVADLLHARREASQGPVQASQTVPVCRLSGLGLAGIGRRGKCDIDSQATARRRRVRPGALWALDDGSILCLPAEHEVSAYHEIINETGVAPDYYIPLTANDLASGHDPDLAKALALLGG